MKKEYIKPTILGVYAQTEKNLMNHASQYAGPTNGFVTEDTTEDGGEAEGAAAKDLNAWAKWDD